MVDTWTVSDDKLTYTSSIGSAANRRVVNKEALLRLRSLCAMPSNSMTSLAIRGTSARQKSDVPSTYAR